MSYKNGELPSHSLHLGKIKLSTLPPIFRRQAVASQLAYSHVIIHAYRPFLPGDEFPIDTSRIEERLAGMAPIALADRLCGKTAMTGSFAGKSPDLVFSMSYSRKL